MKAPRSLGTVLLTVVAMILTGCTPGTVRMRSLPPAPSPQLLTLHDLYLNSNVDVQAAIPNDMVDELKNYVMLTADQDEDGQVDLVAGIALREMEKLYWLEAAIANLHPEMDFQISLSGVHLMTSTRQALRRLLPHEAANLFTSEMTGAPQYIARDYSYTSVSNVTVSSVRGSPGYTNSTVSQGYDWGAAAGDVVGNAIVAGIVATRNQKLADVAERVYSTGILDGAAVPPEATFFGGVYWSRPDNAVGSLTLRFSDLDLEVVYIRTLDNRE